MIGRSIVTELDDFTCLRQYGGDKQKQKLYPYL